MIAKKYRVSFWSDANALKLMVVMVAQLCEYTKKKQKNKQKYTFNGWTVLMCEYFNKTVAKKTREKKLNQ